MRRNIEEKRLRAIKSKFVILGRKCECCKDEVSFEKMWYVQRWGVNRRIYQRYYCQKCTPTAQDVLNKIDNDACPFGIAYVDGMMKPQNKERQMEALLKLEKQKNKQKNKKKKK